MRAAPAAVGRLGRCLGAIFLGDLERLPLGVESPSAAGQIARPPSSSRARRAALVPPPPPHQPDHLRSRGRLTECGAARFAALRREPPPREPYPL